MKGPPMLRKPSELTMITGRIVIIYLIVGILWIVTTDRILNAIISDPAILSSMQTIKGWTYVLATGLLLYLLIRWGMRTFARSEQALYDSENRYRQMFERNEAIKLLIDPADGSIVDANPAAAHFYGYSLGDLKTKKISDINTLPPEQIASEMEKAATEQSTYFVFQHLLASGDIRDVEVYSGPINSDGRTLLFSIIHDITARRNAESALRRRNAELDALYETMLGLINRLDRQSLLEAIVARAASLAEIPHVYLYVVEPGEDGEPQLVIRAGVGFFESQLGYVLHRGEGLSGRVWQTGEIISADDYSTWSGRRTDLDHFEIHALVGLPLSVNREVVGVIGLAHMEKGRSISPDEIALLERFGKLAALTLENARLYAATQHELAEKKQAEAALIASEGRYRMLMEQAAEGILVSTVEGRFLDANSFVCTMCGYTHEEMLNMSLRDLIDPEDFAKRPPRVTEVLTGRVLVNERLLRRKDGSAFHAQTSTKLLPDGRVQSIIRDITERKAYEQRLEEHTSQQSHLLDQLLTAQEAERRRLSMEIHDGPLQSLGVSLLALDRIIRRHDRHEYELVGQELRYAREIVTGTVAEVRAILADISLELLTSYGLASALRDHAERFTQVTGIEVGLHNTVEDRLPSHLELLLYRLAQESLANVRKHAEATHVDISLSQDGNRVNMTVKDNGKGFNPAAPTEKHRSGENIGIPSMRQRIREAQGDMTIQSSPDKGTTITFSCPIP